MGVFDLPREIARDPHGFFTHPGDRVKPAFPFPRQRHRRERPGCFQHRTAPPEDRSAPALRWSGVTAFQSRPNFPLARQGGWR